MKQPIRYKIMRQWVAEAVRVFRNDPSDSWWRKTVEIGISEGRMTRKQRQMVRVAIAKERSRLVLGSRSFVFDDYEIQFN